MPWRDISSAASWAVSVTVSVRSGAVITASIGVVSASCGSVTRPRMSWRVRMPRGVPSASLTSTEPMRRSCIVASACTSGASGGTDTGLLRGSEPSGDSSDCSASVCDE